jgi:hypothetical protein
MFGIYARVKPEMIKPVIAQLVEKILGLNQYGDRSVLNSQTVLGALVHEGRGTAYRILDTASDNDTIVAAAEVLRECGGS